MTREYTPLKSGWFQTARGEMAHVIPAELTANNRPYGGGVHVFYQNGDYTAAFLTTFQVWGWTRCNPPERQ